ncbi:MAG TPA: hypothetical protein VIK35_00490 [Verrucomicrobiae bacterium]
MPNRKSASKSDPEKVRDVLLAEYKGQEKQMEGFGYSVVMGSAATPQRQPKTQTAKPA